MKKNILRRAITAVLALTLAAGMLTGCGSSKNGGSAADGGKTLFTYDGVDVPLKEASIYAKMTAAQYEATYSSYFGPDFWSMGMGTDEEGNTTTFEDYVKEQVITQIKQIKVLDNKAEELGCSLTDEDKAECEKYAKAFAQEEMGKTILKDCGASVEDIQKIYEDNALASKVQKEMVKDVDTNVSDDEARKTTIDRVVFATTKTDDDGNSVDMTDEEKAQVKKTAEDAYAKLAAGTSIEDIAKEQEYSNTSETFAAGESEEGEKFEKKLAGMKDGDIVDGVQECENGYVIAVLKAYTDKEATDSHKEEIIEERKNTAFHTKYDEWTADLEKDWDYKTSVDQELWATVVLHAEDSTATEAAAETDTAAQADTSAEGDTAAQADTAAEADTAAQTDTQTQTTEDTQAVETTTEAK